MTREEAHKILSNGLVNAPSEHEWCMAFRMAIKALEQQPCEDTISRREAIKMFTCNYKGERIPDYDCDNFPTQIDIKTVKEILRKLPSVTPQPKIDVFDKIREDIMDICCDPYCENPLTAGAVREMILEILDEYKAESEE